MDANQTPFPAPDFRLSNFDGEPFTLSEYCSRKPVVLVFNRSFG